MSEEISTIDPKYKDPKYRSFLVKTLAEDLSREVSEILHVPARPTYASWRGIAIDAELGPWIFRSSTWNRLVELGEKYGADVAFDVESTENGLVVHLYFDETPLFPEMLRWRRWANE